MAASADDALDLQWDNGREFARLHVDLRGDASRIEFSHDGRTAMFRFAPEHDAIDAPPTGRADDATLPDRYSLRTFESTDA